MVDIKIILQGISIKECGPEVYLMAKVLNIIKMVISSKDSLCMVKSLEKESINLQMAGNTKEVSISTKVMEKEP